MYVRSTVSLSHFSKNFDHLCEHGHQKFLKLKHAASYEPMNAKKGAIVGRLISRDAPGLVFMQFAHKHANLQSTYCVAKCKMNFEYRHAFCIQTCRIFLLCAFHLARQIVRKCLPVSSIRCESVRLVMWKEYFRWQTQTWLIDSVLCKHKCNFYTDISTFCRFLQVFRCSFVIDADWRND